MTKTVKQIELEDHGYIWFSDLREEDKRFSEFLKNNGLEKRYKLRLTLTEKCN